jgi:hypothetical protein
MSRQIKGSLTRENCQATIHLETAHVSCPAPGRLFAAILTLGFLRRTYLEIAGFGKGSASGAQSAHAHFQAVGSLKENGLTPDLGNGGAWAHDGAAEGQGDSHLNVLSG